MRLLSIAILSVLLFFPLYAVLHPLFGPNWAAGIAAFFMYIGLPAFFLFIFPKEWKHPLIKFMNYLLAAAVLWISFYFLYLAFTEGRDEINAIRFFWFYGIAAFYYLAFGRMRYEKASEDEA